MPSAQGHVAPRQVTETRDLKRHFHRILKFFPVGNPLACSKGCPCVLMKKIPEYLERIATIHCGDMYVESCHVSGCHSFILHQLREK